LYAMLRFSMMSYKFGGCFIRAEHLSSIIWVKNQTKGSVTRLSCQLLTM
jgi:hypothetical protein